MSHRVGLRGCLVYAAGQPPGHLAGLVPGQVSQWGALASDSSLVWFDPTTGSVQQVLTPQPASIGVASAVAFNADGEEPFLGPGGFAR
jgi:hypothetical protein